MNSQKLKISDVLLILLGFVLFSGSLYLYLTDFPLRYYIFEIEPEIPHTPIGKISLSEGTTKRKPHRELEFFSIDQGKEVYSMDTIVTGPESNSTITLKDGAEIKVGPLSMVQLAFAPKYRLTGINHVNRIVVISGHVSGKAGAHPLLLKVEGKNSKVIPGSGFQKKAEPVLAPSPVPSPLPSLVPSPVPTLAPLPVVTSEVALLAPKENSKISLPPYSKKLEVPISFQWDLKGPLVPVQLSIYKIEGKHQKKVVIQKQLPAASNRAHFDMAFRKPGEYEWELKVNPKLAPKKRRFRILPEFEGIRVLPALVGGQAQNTNTQSGEGLNSVFNIELEWEPIASAKEYQIKMSRNQDFKEILFEKPLHSNRFTFNKNKVLNGTFYYSLSATLPSGFRPYSSRQLFEFQFLPPILVRPKHGDRFSLPPGKKVMKSVLISWQRTTFTENYELQVSQDPEFKQSVLQRRQKENFYMMRDLKPGSYWWRVRSLTGEVTSSMSRTFEFIVTGR